MWKRSLNGCRTLNRRYGAPARWLLLLPLLAALLAAGCANEGDDWARAKSTGTIEAYETFLGQWPKSPRSQQADDLIWQLTSRNGKGTAKDYETFLERHGTSPHARQAMDGIWTLTAADNTISSYEAFIVKHANDPHVKQAMDGIWTLTAAGNTISSYEAFIVKHANDPHVKQAADAVRTLWASVRPAKPECSLTSELTVDVRWEAMPGAESYVLYWSESSKGKTSPKRSEASTGTFFNHKARVGEYGAQLPMYYRVAAVKAGGESAPSDACVARLRPDKDGTVCQICGEKAEAGYCHLREIYVCYAHNTFTADSGTQWQCP